MEYITTTPIPNYLSISGKFGMKMAIFIRFLYLKWFISSIKNKFKTNKMLTYLRQEYIIEMDEIGTPQSFYRM